MALNVKYGFMSAPGTRTSNLVADGGTDGGEMIRMEAARESYPYVMALGAQNASPPTRRLYPFMVGTICFLYQKFHEGRERGLTIGMTWGFRGTISMSK